MVVIDKTQYVLPLEFTDRRNGDRRQHAEAGRSRSAYTSHLNTKTNVVPRRGLTHPKPIPQAAFLAQEIAQDLQKSSRRETAAASVRRYQVSMGDEVTIEGPVRDVRLKI